MAINKKNSLKFYFQFESNGDSCWQEWKYTSQDNSLALSWGQGSMKEKTSDQPT